MMDNLAVEHGVNNAFAYAGQIAQESAGLWGDVAMKMMLPSVLYRPILSRDGNKWCVLYGDNIAEGCCGFGDSPEEAMKDFNKNWSK